MSEQLSPRQERILFAVCREYVATGAEVASSALARAHGLSWSPATIRAELGALERMGLMQRSHHSAGRRPTADGLSLYIDSLPRELEPRPELALAVDRSLGGDAGWSRQQSMRATAWVLSDVAGCMAVSFIANAREGLVRDIDVTPLHGTRALVVLTMEDGSDIVRTVSLQSLAQARTELDSRVLELRDRLRWLCRGRTLAHARSKLLALQDEHEAKFDRVLGEALRVGLTLCQGAALDPLWLQVAGRPSLTAEHNPTAPLADVLELLEDVHRLADVLCQLIPDPGRSRRAEALVRLSGRGPLPGLTVVGCRIPMPLRCAEGRRTGAIALLGSDRMDYASVIPLVEYTARALAVRTSA